MNGRCARRVAAIAAWVVLIATPAPSRADEVPRPLSFAPATRISPNLSLAPLDEAVEPAALDADREGRPATSGSALSELPAEDVVRTVRTVGLFALISLAPAALLMVTAYVRISIVLTLLRQALGSPQVPGNQVLMALAVLLTGLVMAPVGERVYRRAVVPYSEGKLSPAEAWAVSTGPVKTFMLEQIYHTHHEHYLSDLDEWSRGDTPGRGEELTDASRLPLRVVAPAFLLSELTTALFIGFLIYLPFLVIDLVVSAVLAAMGLIMMPPSLVAMPLKLILFVLADGWWLVSSGLLRGFATG